MKKREEFAVSLRKKKKASIIKQKRHRFMEASKKKITLEETKLAQDDTTETHIDIDGTKDEELTNKIYRSCPLFYKDG